MKILHNVHRYKPAIGGSEQYMVDLSEHLVRRGHEITVFTSKALDSDSWKDELPSCEIIEGVKINRFHSIPRTKLIWKILHYGYSNYPQQKNLITQIAIFLGNGPISLSWALSPYTIREKYDLVHVTALPYSHLIYAYRYAKRHKTPFIVTPFVHVEQQNVFNVKYFYDIMKNADMVISATDYEKRYLQHCGINPEKIRTVGLGIDFIELGIYSNVHFKSQIGLDENDEYILFLGRKEYYKGIDVLIKTFNSVKRDYPNLYLILIGPKTSYSVELMGALKDKDRIIEVGKVSEIQKNGALKGALITILPSVHESFGIVFLESWANAVPVLGARSGAIVDVVTDGYNGLLFTPGDSIDLESKLRSLLDDKDMRERMGKSGLKTVIEKYTKEKIVDKIECVYETTIRR